MIIKDIDVELNQLTIKMDNGEVHTWIDEPDCCASKYFETDGDDLRDWIGAEYLGWELRDCNTEDKDGGVHETGFLVIHTNCSHIVLSCHNEHNGYYGGIRPEHYVNGRHVIDGVER